jgi:hypothetical protein
MKIFVSRPKMPGQVFSDLINRCRTFSTAVKFNDDFTLTHYLCKDRIKEDPVQDDNDWARISGRGVDNSQCTGPGVFHHLSNQRGYGACPVSGR